MEEEIVVINRHDWELKLGSWNKVRTGINQPSSHCDVVAVIEVDWVFGLGREGPVWDGLAEGGPLWVHVQNWFFDII